MLLTTGCECLCLKEALVHQLIVFSLFNEQQLVRANESVLAVDYKLRASFFFSSSFFSMSVFHSFILFSHSI